MISARSCSNREPETSSSSASQSETQPTHILLEDPDDDILGVLIQYNLFDDDHGLDNGDHEVAATMLLHQKNAMLLLRNENNVNRDKLVEKKESLMAYQRIQALAIVKYLQLFALIIEQVFEIHLNFEISLVLRSSFRS
jgi:hypothetical protein